MPTDSRCAFHVSRQPGPAGVAAGCAAGIAAGGASGGAAACAAGGAATGAAGGAAVGGAAAGAWRGAAGSSSLMLRSSSKSSSSPSTYVRSVRARSERRGASGSATTAATFSPPQPAPEGGKNDSRSTMGPTLSGVYFRRFASLSSSERVSGPCRGGSCCQRSRTLASRRCSAHLRQPT